MQISLDQDSYQARLDGDAGFFLRRLLTPSHRLTDIRFGALPAEQHAAALHHFMICTGGWPTQRLEYDAIGYDEDSPETLDTAEQEVRRVIERALPWGQIEKTEREAVWRRVMVRFHLSL